VDVNINGRRHAGGFVERDTRPSSGPLRHAMRSRSIDQNAAHHLTRDAEELAPVLPYHPALIHQPQIGLVHERRGLQAMPRSLATQPCGCPTAKLLVQHRHQLVTGVGITRGPGMQERRHVVTGRIHGMEAVTSCRVVGTASRT
jgi:hypothetical protein